MRTWTDGGRMLRMLWARVRLAAPSMLGGRFRRLPCARITRSLQQRLAKPERVLRPYERLAAVYHELGRPVCPGYVPFLRTLASAQGNSLESVLELACGAGTLTTQLASIATRVVGIDLSPEMLCEARRRCRGQANVRLTEGDFRNFDEREQFDAVVCASDSLNYLRTPMELGQVFACIGRHLRPRGVLVFDALDDRGFRLYSGRVMRVRAENTEVEMVFRYDAKTRVAESVAIFGGEIEIHRRIPIELGDVVRATAGTQLRLRDHFSMVWLGLLRKGGIRNFYVLQTEGGA